MRTISIVNLKGGVGKSTTSQELAYLMGAKYGKKVLLIDNDKQGNTSRMFRKYNESSPVGMHNVLLGGRIEENTVEEKYFNFVPCNPGMKIAEHKLSKSKGMQHDVYRKALIGLKYDYCIIDNPPDIGLGVINALVASDEIIVPLCMDNYSLDGLGQIEEQIKDIMMLNPKAKLSGILITDYERTEVAEEMEKWLRHEKGEKVFETRIRHSKQVKASTVYQKPLEEYSPRCGAAVDYRRFVQELLRREAEWAV